MAGYKKPTKPAAVSGPGKFSKRTDGGVSQPIRDISGGDYGDSQNLRDLQAAAPLNASGRSVAPATPSPAVPTGPEVVPLHADTQRPEEPVTAGSPLGPGPGPAPSAPANYEHLRQYLPILSYIANGPNGNPDLRNAVRTLKGAL